MENIYEEMRARAKEIVDEAIHGPSDEPEVVEIEEEPEEVEEPQDNG